jgi:hypothetical protein
MGEFGGEIGKLLGTLGKASLYGQVASAVGGTGAGIGATIGGLVGPEGAMIGYVVGKVTEDVGRLGAAIATMPIKIERWADSLMESTRDLRRFNGTIANVFAQLDRQQIMLGVRTARETGGTTAGLGEALMDLREEMQPLKEIAINVRNLGATGAVRFATAMVKQAEPMLRAALIAVFPVGVGLAIQVALDKILEEIKRNNRVQGNQFQQAVIEGMRRPINDKF